MFPELLEITDDLKASLCLHRSLRKQEGEFQDKERQNYQLRSVRGKKKV
jgi:hypothetical protein